MLQPKEQTKGGLPKTINDYLKVYKMDPYAGLGLPSKAMTFEQVQQHYLTLNVGIEKHDAAYKILKDENFKIILDSNLPEILESLKKISTHQSFYHAPKGKSKFSLNLTKIDPQKYYIQNGSPYGILKLTPEDLQNLTSKKEIKKLLDTQAGVTTLKGEYTIDVIEDAVKILERPSLRSQIDTILKDTQKLTKKLMPTK